MKRSGSVIAGYYGFNNAGDELILRSILDQIRQEQPNSSVTVLSNDPAQTRRHFQLDAVNRWHPWAWFGPMRRASRFILGGGGLLQESTGPWNHAYYLLLVLFAKILGCRTEIRAVGVDPVHHWFNRWWTRFVLSTSVDMLSVRDSDSQRALELIGVHTPVLRTSDPIFQVHMPPASPTGARLALVVTAWPERPGWEHDLALLCDRVTDQLKVAVDLLVFFPAEDEALSQRVAGLVATPVTVRRWSQPEEVLKWIGEYQLIISMRYHALALASLAERPFIGWGFQKKVRSLCRDFGQPIWSFERGWDGESVFRQIGEAWRNRDQLPHRYRERVKALRHAVPTLQHVSRIYPSQV